MPFYVNDYLGDTMRLTTIEHGAYFLLLLEAWKRAGRLPSEERALAAIVRMTPREWRKISSTIKAFFLEDDRGLYHKRVLQEFERAQRLSETRRESGMKGGRPPKQTESEMKANGYANGNQNHKQTETHARVARPSQLQNPTGSCSDDKSSGPDMDLDRRAWKEATRLLMGSGMAEKSARAFFGKLLSDNHLIARQMLPSLASVELTGTPEPQAYLSRAAKGAGKPKAPVLPYGGNIQ